MKNPYVNFGHLFIFIACFLAHFVSLQGSPIPSETYGDGFRFTENKNQWASDVLFRANIPHGFLFLQKSGFQYTFYDAEGLRKFHHPEGKSVKTFGTQNRYVRAENLPAIQDNEIRAHGVKVSFLGYNENYSVQTKGMGAERKNYFIGKDVAYHARDVRSFGKVIYSEIYTHIDFQFFTQENHLKYEFLVRPNGNPHQIQLKYDHASKLYLRDGHLIVQTSLNEFSEQKPYCYQIINGKKIEVSSRFVLKDKVLSYEFTEGYDKNYELVIDPTVVFSTYSGSVSDNWGFTATYDEAGNMYTGGIAFGADFPTTTGAFTVEFIAEVDISIHKYNENGTQLLYGTYLGGELRETPHSLVVDKDNRLIIMGATGSSDMPVTSGAFQQQFAGGEPLATGFSIDFPNGADIYTAVLSASGNKLEACTYLGGSSTDGIMTISESPLVFNYGDETRGDVGTDSEGNIYLVSYSRSSNFPTVNAMQSQFGGSQDAVIVKMSPDLKTMHWGTYYGGSGFDGAFSMSLTDGNDIYVAGSTRSTNLRTHSTALHSNFQGISDGFLVRLNTENGAFMNATYLGTTNFDMGYLTDTDADGNAYLFGLTVGDYPIRNSNLSSVGRGQFIHKLDLTLSRTVFSTRFGSGDPLHFLIPNLSPTAFRVTDCGDIYLAGWGGATNTNFAARAMGLEVVSTMNMPTTQDAIRRNSDGSDFYLMILDRNANKILYASYFGGVNLEGGDHDHVDGGTSRFSKDGTIYHAVCACRTNPLPTTSGTWSSTNPAATNIDIGEGSGGCNMYSIKLNINDLRAKFRPLNANGILTNEGCNPLKIYLDNQSENANRYEWKIENIGTFTTFEPVITFSETGTYAVQLTAFNDALCIQQTINDTIRVLGSPYSISPDTLVCKGQAMEIKATGGNEYLWRVMTGDGLNPSEIRKANPIVTPSITSTYGVTITTSEGCRYDTMTTVKVIETMTLKFQTTVENRCENIPTISFTNLSTGADEYFWDFGNGTTFIGKNPPAITYEKTGEYVIILQGKNQACEVSDSVKIRVVSDKITADFEVELIQLCEIFPTVKITNTSADGAWFFWDFGNGKTYEGENPPDFKYEQEGNFVITLTVKNNECEDTENQQVEIYSEFISDFVANITKSEDQLICQTETVQLEASGGVRYAWSPAETLNDARIPNPIASPSQTTDYTVTIYSPRGCGIDTTIRVEVAPKIDLKFEVQNSMECGKRASFNFENYTTNFETFTWTMGDGQVFENQNPPANFQYEKSGTYTLVLEASNRACSQRQEIQVVANNIMPPNVITPNGDGKNDVFDIGVRVGGWKLEIYDRWGKKVYQSESYENDWGNNITNTIYFYRLTSPQGDSCTGWVQVIK